MQHSGMSGLPSELLTLNLRRFLLIAEKGYSIRGTAQVLGITNGAVSKSIRSLEQQRGPLFRRDKHNRPTGLTRLGEALLAQARLASVALSGVDAMMERDANTVRVGAGATASSYLLPEAVREFVDQNESSIFHLREGTTSRTLAALLEGEIDLGIVARGRMWAAPRELKGSRSRTSGMMS